jgi:hypothetical protein
MTRPTKSYAELQRQNISADLRQRQTSAREASVTALRMASVDSTAPPSLVGVSLTDSAAGGPSVP